MNNCSNFTTIAPRAKKRDICILEADESPKPNSEKKHEYSYSCAMLPLSDESCALIKYWSKKFIPKKNLYINEDEGIDGYDENSHVTVKYGLHDSTPDNLSDLISGVGAVPLKFGVVSKFDTHPNYDVIKLVVKGEKLMMLNKMISASLETTDTFPEYIPHATIAYVKKGSCDHLLDNDFFDKLSDKVDTIHFSSRDGTDHLICL